MHVLNSPENSSASNTSHAGVMITTARLIVRTKFDYPTVHSFIGGSTIVFQAWRHAAAWWNNLEVRGISSVRWKMMIFIHRER